MLLFGDLQWTNYWSLRACFKQLTSRSPVFSWQTCVVFYLLIFDCTLQYQKELNCHMCWLIWQIHEDPKKGLFVENLTEVEVKNVGDVMELLHQVYMSMLVIFGLYFQLGLCNSPCKKTRDIARIIFTVVSNLCLLWCIPSISITYCHSSTKLVNRQNYRKGMLYFM